MYSTERKSQNREGKALLPASGGLEARLGRYG
jgi:hypothetical protein